MSNDTIFREVEEELRSERMRNLWRRFGPYVIGAAVGVVLVVAVNEGYRWWQNSNASRSSDQLYSALELAGKGDVAGAEAQLDQLAETGSGAYPTLARFKKAALLAKEGKTDEAVAAYDQLAGTESNRRLRELAQALAGYLLVDSGDVAAVEERVGTLMGETGALRNAAREAIGLTKYKAGDLDGARASLEAILADPMANDDLRGRIQVYLAQLIAEGAMTPQERAAANAAPAPAAVEDAAPAEPIETPPAADEAPAADAAPVAPALEGIDLPAAPAETVPAAPEPAEEAAPPAEPAAPANN